MNIKSMISQLQTIFDNHGDLELEFFNRSTNAIMNFISVGYNEENNPTAMIVIANIEENIIEGMPPGGFEFLNRPESGVKSTEDTRRKPVEQSTTIGEPPIEVRN